MSSKQVPEGQTVASKEEQLAKLREKLMGNQVFGRCRGKLGSALELVDHVENTNSPTEFLNTWDSAVADARVMGNLLATYKRDRWMHAFDALREALYNKAYFFPGETAPLHETSPITILMLDPERTMLMLEWIVKEHWMELNAWLDKKDGTRTDVTWLSERTMKLFEMFPTLERRCRDRRRYNFYEGSDLIFAHRDTVVDAFPQIRNIPMKARDFTFGQWNDHIELEAQQFLFLYEGDQGDLLANFSREEQERIGTWQFDVPKALRFFDIGLHPESEHERWQKEFPAFASKGTSHGLGAFITEENPVHARRGEPVKYPHREGPDENEIIRFIFDGMGGFD
jgi:hypothetical protein